MEDKENKVIDSEDIDNDEDLDLDDFDDQDDDEGRSQDDDEGSEEGEKEQSKEEGNKKPAMSREERARQAKMRREREAKERAQREKEIEKKAYLKGQLDSTKVNTFTNEPIKDEYDLKVFNLQKEIERDGGDPINDLPKALADLERKEASAKKQKEDEKKEANDTIAKDIADFRGKYPDVNLRELLEDPDFRDYSEGRLGVKGGKSLAEIYEGYNRFITKFKPAVDKKEEEDGKIPPPSPNGGRKQEKTSYSQMSETDRQKLLRKQGMIN